jgi:hypothetical protein
MFARLSAYPPESAVVEVLLSPPQTSRIGRMPPCDLVLPDASVSRLHAELLPAPTGWELRDHDSKNGTWVDGERVASRLLQRPAWLRFGDVHCEFRLIDNDQALLQRRRTSERRNRSITRTELTGRQEALPGLLRETLAAVVDLSNSERGFLLLAEPDGLIVRATQGLDTAAMARRGFGGSAGVVERVRRERAPLVLHDIGLDPGLGGRASVIAGGLRTVAAIPLLLGDELLGIVYADSARAGNAVTTLDMQLLAAFAERAALWIAARRSAAELAALPQAPAWAGIAAVHATAAP